MTKLNELIRKIQKYDARRHELRARVLEEGASEGSGGNYDSELIGLNSTIESYAKQVNQTLKKYAKDGVQPGPIRIGAILDPELKQFLEEVQKTCSHLETVNPLGGQPGSGSAGAAALARSKTDGARIRRDIEKRQRDYRDEVRKTKRAQDDVEKELRKLDQEENKIEKQRDEMVDQRKRLQREQDETNTKKGASEKEQARLEREKRQMITQLKSLTQARRRPVLEQKIQKINHAIAKQKHCQKNYDTSLDRQRRILESMDKEIEHLDEALGRVDEERERLKEDRVRLDERLEQINKALDVEESRLLELKKAELSLRVATTP